MIISEISDFKKDQLRYELRNEPANNFAIYIDGKKWKVFKGEGFNADDAREEKQFTRLKNLCKRKSFETGKDWQVGKTGEEPTQEGMFDKIKKAVDDVKNFHKTDAAKQVKKDHEKRVQKGKEIIDAPNLRKRLKDLQQNEAKQAKASDPKPKLIKPNKGNESPHPMRGKLVGEAVPYRKSVQKDLDDRIWNAKPPVKGKDADNDESDDVKRERRWKDTVRTKAEEGIRPEKPSKNSEELLAMGYKPDSGKVQRAREYEAWVEKQRAQGKDVDEGKSPHKKGSTKYKKHMAAMHAGMNEGTLVFHKESELRGMLDTLLKSWKQEEHTPGEFRALVNALGYNFKKVTSSAGEKIELVKAVQGAVQSPDPERYVDETEEPKADTSARAKLNHSLVSQGHKVEKDKKKELKKGAVKHKGNLYDNLISLEK